MSSLIQQSREFAETWLNQKSVNSLIRPRCDPPSLLVNVRALIRLLNALVSLYRLVLVFL